MHQVVYQRLRSKPIKEPYFNDTKLDASGYPSCFTDQKMCAALLQLVERVSSRAIWNYLKNGTSTAREALKQFSPTVFKNFKAEYLRDPTAEELERFSSSFEPLGLPGCIGSSDDAGWAWDSCPIGWQGSYTGASKKPTLRMEAVCDDCIYCWHLCFWSPGSKSDMNILYLSKFFQHIHSGAWAPFRPNSMLSGMVFTLSYELTDGICPDWRVFVKTYTNPWNQKQNTFSKQQEAVRKGIERFFWRALPAGPHASSAGQLVLQGGPDRHRGGVRLHARFDGDGAQGRLHRHPHGACGCRRGGGR